MLSRFLILFAVFCLCFIVQESGALMVSGVLPDLILIFFFVLVCRGERPGILAALLILSIVVAYLKTPFWTGEAFLFAAVVAVSAALRRFLTGNDFLDYAILVVSGSVVLELLLMLISGAPFRLLPFAIAVGYTGILGVVLWFLVPHSFRINKQGTSR